MKTKGFLAGTLSLIIASSTPLAMAEDVGSPIGGASNSMDVIEEKMVALADQYQLQLRAELALADLLIKSIETSQYVNDALDLDKANVYVMVPSVLTLGLGGTAVGSRLSDAIVRTITPEKSAWFTEYGKLKASVRQAKLALAKAKIKNPGQLAANSSHLTIEQGNLLVAQKAVSDHLLKRPGAFYNAGRFLRLAGRSTVFVAGISMSVMVLNETAVLVMGREEVNDLLSQLRKRAAELDSKIESVDNLLSK